MPRLHIAWRLTVPILGMQVIVEASAKTKLSVGLEFGRNLDLPTASLGA